MAHFAGIRPLGEFHFCHKGRLYPRSDSFASHFFWKRRFCHLQFDQLAVKFFQGRMAEARTYVTNEAPFLAFADGERQCSEKGPRPSRGCKAGNNDLLAFRRLDLQPIICTGSRQVLAIGALGHDAFEAATVGLMEEFLAEGSTVITKRD